MRINEASDRRKKTVSRVVAATLVATVVLPLVYVAFGSIVAIVHIVLG